jgi:telomerase reverse transcriptase
MLAQTFVESDPPPDDLEDFVPYAIELASTLKNTILVDQIPYQPQRKEDLIQLLDEHITENIVKVARRCMLMCSAS